ncbi:MAG: efflux RND transporter periplasmic adaptor subunit [Oceanicaulis sp.]
MTDERTRALHSLAIDREDDAGGRSGPGWLGLIVTSLVTAGLGAGGAWVYLQTQQPEASTTSQIARPAAEPREARESPAEPAVATRAEPRASGLVASGYVVARRQATVSAEITGRIREVLIEEGAVVEAGDVLARLDDERARLDLDLFEAQARSADARVRSLSAQLDEAQVQLDRAQRLVGSGFASEASVTALQAQRDSLVSQIAAARADAAAARVRLASQVDFVDRHVVRAPFAGVVIAKNAQVGEILSPVSAGGGFTRTGIATLVDMSSLELEVDVNEGQIQRVSAGQPVEAVLDAYPDWRIPARVEAIIPTADRARATIQVRVTLLERDTRVLPDMAARVTFLEGE